MKRYIDKKDVTTIAVSKETQKALRILSISEGKSICEFLDDLVVENIDQQRLAVASPVLAVRKKALARKKAA